MSDVITEDALRSWYAVIFDWDGTLTDTQDGNYQTPSAISSPSAPMTPLPIEDVIGRPWLPSPTATNPTPTGPSLFDQIRQLATKHGFPPT